MKKSVKAILLIILILGLFAAGGAAWLYSGIKSAAVAEAGDVYVTTGTTFDGLVSQLEDEGRIKDMSKFRSTAKLLKFNGNARPGRYVLKDGMDYRQTVRLFQRGLQTPVRVTFNNIRLLPQLAGKVGPQIESDSIEIVQTLLADTTAAHYGFNRNTFIAMFIPNTYEFYWNTTPTGFIDRMHTEYERFWNEERRAKLDDTGLTQVQAVTLASIVYEETKMSDEMPTVAGVYMNRIKQNHKLEADPTVKYAVGDFGLRRILFRHLEIDSPYNTYRYAGLPPGPICMPSVQAIDAVLNYQQHRYMFMCARPDYSGYHNFAVTNAEHERNRAAYIRFLNSEGIR